MLRWRKKVSAAKVGTAKNEIFFQLNGHVFGAATEKLETLRDYLILQKIIPQESADKAFSTFKRDLDALKNARLNYTLDKFNSANADKVVECSTAFRRDIDDFLATYAHQDKKDGYPLVWAAVKGVLGDIPEKNKYYETTSFVDDGAAKSATTYTPGQYIADWTMRTIEKTINNQHDLVGAHQSVERALR